MNIVTLGLDKIDDSNRYRPVDPIHVNILAESIAENGQMSPMEVLALPKAGTYRLIAGAHRLAALRKLGRTEGLFTVFEGTADEAGMREIDENLCRHDLNELDRSIFLGERKKLYEKLHPETKAGKGEGKQDVAKMATVLRFTLDATHNTGLAERTIQRLVARFENIDPMVRSMLRGTWIATSGKDLDALARLPMNDQIKVVKMMLREEDAQPDVATAYRLVRGLPQTQRSTADEEFSKLVSLWRKTGAPARKRFREFLEAPESRKAGA